MPPIVGFIVMLVLAAGFGTLLVFISSKLGPKTTSSRSKASSYECGLEVTQEKQRDSGKSGSKTLINYYLTALLFVLFDIEIIFLYPLALAYKDFISKGLGLYLFVALIVFLTVFILGLLWEVKSRALKWD